MESVQLSLETFYRAFRPTAKEVTRAWSNRAHSK